MPDRTLARLDDLEGWRRDHQRHPVGPTPGEMYAMFTGLPGLRGYWPMSSQTQAAGDLVYDLSGQGRSLTRTGAEMVGVYNDVVPYAEFNGTTDNLNRADETGLDITGALTLGGWFWLDSLTGVRPLMSKWGTGLATRAYSLDVNAGTARLTLGTGAAVTSYNGSAVSVSGWHFIVGRRVASSTADIFVDGVETNNASVLAALVNSANAFRIGHDDDANFLDGRAGPCFLCAAALSDNLLSLLLNRSRSLFGA